MSTVLSSWRQAVADLMAEAFPTFKVYSGFREGPHRDMSVIAVFSPGLGERADNVQVAELRLLVRAWPKSIPHSGGEAPQDPAPLEDLAVQLETTLQAAQTSLASTAGVWFTRLERVEIDYEEWGVQARLLAMADNPAVLA